jgi:hypothetical protein
MNIFKKLFRKKEYLVCEGSITQVLNEKQVLVDKGYSDGITMNTEFYFYKKYETKVESINPYLEENGIGEILQLESSFTVIRPFVGVNNSPKKVGDIVTFKIPKK